MQRRCTRGFSPYASDDASGPPSFSQRTKATVRTGSNRDVGAEYALLVSSHFFDIGDKHGHKSKGTELDE
jgi:hypothetical protein